MTLPRNREENNRSHLSPTEIANRIGVSELMIRDALNTGALSAVKIGSRTLVPVKALDHWIAGLPRYQRVG